VSRLIDQVCVERRDGVTEHYASYPAILVRLSQMNRDSLRGLLEGARQFVIAKPPNRRR
jgi:hypothetical protein